MRRVRGNLASSGAHNRDANLVTVISTSSAAASEPSLCVELHAHRYGNELGNMAAHSYCYIHNNLSHCAPV